MINTIKPCIILSAAYGSSFTLGAAANLIDGSTPVTLGSALTCTGVVISCTWWLSRYFSKQQQMHKDNIHRFDVEKKERDRDHRILMKICHKLGIETLGD